MKEAIQQVPRIMLQWGHGSEAVETQRGRDNPSRAPPLQWGHGSEAVETIRSMRRCRLSGWSLQWGHGSEAVETGKNMRSQQS